LTWRLKSWGSSRFLAHARNFWQWVPHVFWHIARNLWSWAPRGFWHIARNCIGHTAFLAYARIQIAVFLAKSDPVEHNGNVLAVRAQIGNTCLAASGNEIIDCLLENLQPLFERAERHAARPVSGRRPGVPH